MLENNIQTALSQQLIDLDDAIDIREIKNVKLANQLLKIKKRKKQERDQALQQRNIKAQADANAQAQQAVAQTEMQKNQQKTEMELQVNAKQAEQKLMLLQQEVEAKIRLMNHEFELNKQMQQMQDNTRMTAETQKEDRLDKRKEMEGKQKSELEVQKQTGRPTKKFESSGNDILGGGLGLDKFSPQIGN